MEKRYRALRFISVFYKIIGWIMLVLSVLGSIAACLMGVLGGSLFNEYSSQIGLQFEGVIAGLITGFALLVFGLVSSLALIAIGEAMPTSCACKLLQRPSSPHRWFSRRLCARVCFRSGM